MSYTARKAQLAASLLHACCLAVIKLISGCVRIAYSVLHDDNKSAASCTTGVLQVDCRLFIHKLDASFFNNLQQVRKYQAAKFLIIFTYLLQPIQSKDLLTTCIKPVKSTTCSKYLCICNIISILSYKALLEDYKR